MSARGRCQARSSRRWERTRPLGPPVLLLGGVVALCARVPAGSAEPARPLERSAGLVAPADPTWADGVANILHGNCVTCHRPAGSAPFSLVDYDEAAPRADRIAEATRRRSMPPWLPDPDIGDFEGARRLSEDDIELLARWAQAGAPRGDPAAAPAPPVQTSEWALGEPDLVVEFPELAVPAQGEDLYRNLVARADVGEGRWVRALDLQPGNVRVAHHARLMVDTTSSSRELAEREAASDLGVMHVSGHATDPGGFFIGWTPGRVPHAGRDDLAWRLEPGTDLVLQVHLRPTGAPQEIRPRAGLYLADAPPARTPVLVLLRSLDIDIAPGDTAFTVEDSYRVPVQVDVLSVYPHAHYVGRRMEAWATLPSGRRRDLIRIVDWDFDWQDEYRYGRPVRLPAGSILTMRYTYDNSSGNPRNPFDPPRRITYGLASTDEMAEMILQVLPSDPDDLGTLRADLDRFHYHRGLRDQATAYRSRAAALEREGRADEALDMYRQSLQMASDPAVMAAMSALMLRRGDAAAAVAAAEQAVALSRGADPRVLAALARAYEGAGRVTEALDVATRAADLAARRGPPSLADSLAALRRSLGGRF